MVFLWLFLAIFLKQYSVLCRDKQSSPLENSTRNPLSQQLKLMDSYCWRTSTHRNVIVHHSLVPYTYVVLVVYQFSIGVF